MSTLQYYATTNDNGDGTYIGVVGPFESRDECKEFFSHPLLADIRWELDEPMTPAEYLETFESE